MRTIRSLAFFNGVPCVVRWLVGTATVTTQGFTARYDTTNEEWGLPTGQNRGLPLGHQWGLFMATDTPYAEGFHRVALSGSAQEPGESADQFVKGLFTIQGIVAA